MRIHAEDFLHHDQGAERGAFRVGAPGADASDRGVDGDVAAHARSPCIVGSSRLAPTIIRNP